MNKTFLITFSRFFLVLTALVLLSGLTTVLADDQDPTPDPNPSTGFKGEYYSKTTTPEGTPTLVRIDDNINFDWSHESPDPSISSDLFSVRWTKNDTFENDTYRFTLTADDGVRLYLDNNLILDKWFDQMITTYTVDQQITGGTHIIKMEFYERYQAGIAKLSYQQILPPTPSPTPTPLPTQTSSPTPVPQAGQVLGSKELPKTGLPALAWVTAALIPIGLKMRGFSKVKGQLKDSPNYLWEERQYKVGIDKE